MKVEASVDVGSFAIFRAGVNEQGTATNAVSDVFWFPDKEVEAGDLVVLYTKRGARSERAQDSGGTVHFFYWGKPNPMWEPTARRIPVLVEALDWQSFKG